MWVLATLAPGWPKAVVHEPAPASSLSTKLASGAALYFGTVLEPGLPRGSVCPRSLCRVEDLEAQTFDDETFDLVVSQDVLEHVFRPDAALREIARTLKPGGLHVFTTPLSRGRRPSRRRALIDAAGVVRHQLPPEHHLAPGGEACLVTWDWGSDLPALIEAWSGLATQIVEPPAPSMGLQGEFLEVMVSRKPRAT
ncbi:MAG TPA: class I SAM-dependent methyltransferase [Caulobacteraceae bacterium]